VLRRRQGTQRQRRAASRGARLRRVLLKKMKRRTRSEFGVERKPKERGGKAAHWSAMATAELGARGVAALADVGSSALAMTCATEEAEGEAQPRWSEGRGSGSYSEDPTASARSSATAPAEARHQHGGGGTARVRRGVDSGSGFGSASSTLALETAGRRRLGSTGRGRNSRRPA
jgi:hypothetical protein